MTDNRVDPPFEADEGTTLTAFLDFLRDTLALKCEGLTDEQLRERAVPPSSLSLLGLVRHMAEVERNWFRPVLGGEEMAGFFSSDLDWEVALSKARWACGRVRRGGVRRSGGHHIRRGRHAAPLYHARRRVAPFMTEVPASADTFGGYSCLFLPCKP